MFPNPQDALPLPPHPDVEQYRKLAKDFVKACRSEDPGAIGAQVERWLATLFGAPGEPLAARGRERFDRAAGQVEEFAVRRLTGGARRCVLADAQFVIARSHGFDSWTKFAAHLDALAHAGGDTADFEAAADAVVSGDEATLRRLLRAKPELARARSTREHRATLLHYVAANGVEGYRQKTPQNITDIARLLLDAGAELDAEADVYGGGCTTLGLAATSAHPRSAGLQIALMRLLIDRGARIEGPAIAGNAHGAAFASLANGCPEAAAYLAERGATLGLVDAAGIGRLDVVMTFFQERGEPERGVAPDVIHTAFRYACFYGCDDVVAYLVERGVDLAGHDGDGQTGLHYAAMGGKLTTIELLLRRHAPLEAVNRYGGTVLGQALWTAAHGGDPAIFVPVIEKLMAAGAQVPARHPPVNPAVDAALARRGSVADIASWWYGEKPRRARA